MHFNIQKIKHLKHEYDLNQTVELFELAKLAPKVDATIGALENGKYTTIKSKYCNAKFVDYEHFIDKINNCITYCKGLVKSKYNLDCIGYNIDFVYYNNGDNYWPHIDGQAFINENTLSKGNTKRDITCILYLNDNYKEGKINFHFFDLSIKPNASDIIMFPSNWQYLHSVEKVIGERYAVVIWFETSPNAYTTSDEIIIDKNILKILQTEKY